MQNITTEEALYLGVPVAHIAAHNERNRLARIAHLSRIAARSWARR